jgi:predicted lysophospholipase L1 biosynthesis ABC-type transport system permease subunit
VHLPPGEPEGVDLTVVGEAVLNDAIGALPGVGALVTPETFARLAPDNQAVSYAVSVEDGADRPAALAALRAAFPTTYLEPTPFGQVRNFGLVERQPLLLAAIVGLFAGAALVHALVLSVRRGRRQIGVLKTLGFTRGQVLASVAWHASLLALAALVVGIPLGVVVGRVVWRGIVSGLGLASPPALPVVSIVGVSLLVLAVANLAALGPGWSAARTRPAATLRTE